VSDNNAVNEQVTVSAASPMLTTTPNPTSVMLGSTPVTLKDTADLEGGYHPGGTITFTLFYNGGTTPVAIIRVGPSLLRSSITAAPRRWTPRR
jgi:hypothetical protein